MADHPVASGARGAYEFTLTADTIDTVTFADNIREVEIIKNEAEAVYVTVDGSVPSVGGAHCYIVPGGIANRVVIKAPAPTDVVKLISAGAPICSVARV